MMLLVVEFGNSQCSPLAEELVDCLTSSLPFMRGKSGQEQISPLIGCFILLKVCNFAH